MAHLTENRKKFVKSYEVLSYDADRQRNIKMSSLQRWFQDAADEHCTAFGCDYMTMRQNMGIVFVLVKSSINVYYPIKQGSSFTAETWHKGANGVQFYRDYTLTDDSGRVCAEGGTSWVIVDPDTHKMKRPSEVAFPVEECRDQVDTARLDKIRMPEPEYAGDKKVMYTEIDANGHLTNWVYADIITNFLPDIAGKRIAEMDISYISEAYQGETLKIFRTEKDGIFFFRGEHPRGKCFEARCRLTSSDR